MDFNDFITLKRIEMNVTNGLSCGTIPHFDDTDIGLVRHLATMDVITLSLEEAFFLRELYFKNNLTLRNYFDNKENRIVFLMNSSGGMRYAVEVYQGNRKVIFDERPKTL